MVDEIQPVSNDSIWGKELFTDIDQDGIGAKLKVIISREKYDDINNVYQIRVRTFLLNGPNKFDVSGAIGTVIVDGITKKWDNTDFTADANTEVAFMDDVYSPTHKADSGSREITISVSFDPKDKTACGFISGVFKATLPSITTTFGAEIVGNPYRPGQTIQLKLNGYMPNIYYSADMTINGTVYPLWEKIYFHENGETFSVDYTFPESMTSVLGAEPSVPCVISIGRWSDITHTRVSLSQFDRTFYQNKDLVKPVITSVKIVDVGVQNVHEILGTEDDVYICNVSLLGTYAEAEARNGAAITKKNSYIDNGVKGLIHDNSLKKFRVSAWIPGDYTLYTRAYDDRGYRSDDFKSSFKMIPYTAPSVYTSGMRDNADPTKLIYKLSTTFSLLDWDGHTHNQASVLIQAQSDNETSLQNVKIIDNVKLMEASIIDLSDFKFSSDYGYTIKTTITDKVGKKSEHSFYIPCEQVWGSKTPSGLGLGKKGRVGYVLDAGVGNPTNSKIDLNGPTTVGSSQDDRGGLKLTTSKYGQFSYGTNYVQNSSNPLNHWNVTESWSTFKFGNETGPMLNVTAKNDKNETVYSGNPIVDMVYPVSSIYTTTNKIFDPNIFFGGTWERFAKGKTLIGVDESNDDLKEANLQGGALTHKHGAGSLEAEIGAADGNVFALGYNPSNKNPTTVSRYAPVGSRCLDNKNRNHNTSVVGSTDTVSSLPPYITVYYWIRTA